MAVIAIDLGGTKLAAAIFNRNGRIVDKKVLPLEGRKGRTVGELICHEVKRLQGVASARGVRVSAIGVSVPGISYFTTGRVWAPNIPGWEDYPLRREIESLVEHRVSSASAPGHRRAPVLIESDRACCILGEAWRGVAKGCDNAIFLVVGTGIGAGILVDGNILRGAHDVAGAIGWLALDRPFRSEYISCGCFEHHASGEGLAKIAKELLARQPFTGSLGIYRNSGRRLNVSTALRSNALTARAIFAAYNRGDRIAKEVLEQAIEFWGMAVANLVSLFNPEKIIFGGGVFGPARRFLDLIHAEARKWAQPIAIKQVTLHGSELGGDAPLYGAARLAFQRQQSAL